VNGRWWVMALLLGLAALPRVVGLDQDFWIDETATVVTYLRLPWWQRLLDRCAWWLRWWL